jgi:hypothetical protein
MNLERVTGIEPVLSPWQGGRLPLHHTRVNGGPYRDRTDDLLNANQALSQLS